VQGPGLPRKQKSTASVFKRAGMAQPDQSSLERFSKREMKASSLTQSRRLGRTGFDVCVLGLGGHAYPIGSGKGFFKSPEDRARLIQYLVNSGINYFDTTWLEEVELLADSFRRSAIGREVLVSLQYVDALSDPKWREKLRQEIEVRLLAMGYSDAPLFLMGMGNGEVSYAELVEACEGMARLKEEGLIRNIGLSCHQIALFGLMGRLIKETDLLDYMMVRFNWKYRQANEELFPVAVERGIGIVGMKVFCWDCGPHHWDRQISVFEPTRGNHTRGDITMTPAQRNLLWCIRNSPCSVVVPAMNTMREAEENVDALRFIDSDFDTADFEKYGNRLWDKTEIEQLSLHAESGTIRERAKILLGTTGSIDYSRRSHIWRIVSRLVDKIK
jgi:aryl-alcohol dehydrogenase-like predicted oxidoreductase